MGSPTCPDCRVPLQPLFIERPGGKPDVRLERCPSCAGLWFDAGELEQTVAHPVTQEQLGAPTDRRCPTCATTMETVLLPGAVPAETCGSCRGVWLDAGELAELGGNEPKRRPRATEQPAQGGSAARRRPAPKKAPPVAVAAATGAAAAGADWQLSSEDFDVSDEVEAPAARQGGGFECAGCGARTPFTDAHGTTKGLVCGRCTPQVQEMPPAPDVEFSRQLTPYGPMTSFDVKAFNFGKLLRYFK